jgi:diguanylate cyclase (GGDEF)-like protein
MNAPDGDKSRELLMRIEAQPESVITVDPSVLDAWRSTSNELLRLGSRVDEQIDPIVKILGSLVSGFHGLQSPAEAEDPDLFEVGARQRARLDRLEKQAHELTQMVDDLKRTLPGPGESRTSAQDEPARYVRGLTTSDASTGGLADRRGASDYQSTFWASYLAVGFFTQLLAMLVMVGYLQTSHYRIHHSILLWAAGGVSVATGIGLVCARWMAGWRWRSQISTLWCLASIGSLGVYAYLDGGLSSPLLYLLALPILYATVALDVAQVRSCVLAAIFQPVWIGLIDSRPTSSYGALVVLFGEIVGVGALALMLAGYRARLQHQQELVVHQLEIRSVTDGLTGCGTNEAFHDRLDNEFGVATVNRKPLGLLVCDVDTLKIYNDTYGHLAGDQLLIRITSTIKSTVRATDFVGRVGGDEFAVILPDTTEKDAYLVAGRIMAKLAKGAGSSAGLSIGVASLDSTVSSPADLFQRADDALYQAKAAGGGAVRTRSAESPRSAGRQ